MEVGLKSRGGSKVRTSYYLEKGWGREVVTIGLRVHGQIMVG